jgi:Fe2+ or Zn2+ uptake regulation protein
MASKRGLNAEEKRKRMLEFFHEKQEFFQLKEVEKLCSSEKGITLNTVKDILTSLVDDGLVDSEKIGISIYYWLGH